MSQIWIARITVDGAESRPLAHTEWASEDEARGFIERRLPGVAVPDGYPAGAAVRGWLMPGETRVDIVDGRAVHVTEPDHTKVACAHVDQAGHVIW